MSPGILLRDPVAHLLRIRLQGPGNANGTLEVLQGFMGFHISGWVDGCRWLDRGPLYGWVWLGLVGWSSNWTLHHPIGWRRRFCWVQYANYHESGGNGERERWAYNSIYSIIANVTLSWTSLSGLSLGTRSFEHGAAAQGEACLKVWQNWVRYPSDLVHCWQN